MTELTTRTTKGAPLTYAEMDANITRTVVQKTAAYQVLISDNRSIIEGDHATTAFTVTLPPVATALTSDTGGFEVTITNINAAIVTVDGTLSELIDGSADVELTQWDSVTCRLNSLQTGWKIIHDHVVVGTVGTTQAKAIMEMVWPVGSVYESTVATNPNTLFGVGTWARISEGRTLIGEGTGSGLTARTAGTEVGQEDGIIASHTHTVGTDGSHSHAGAGAHQHTLHYVYGSSGANQGIGANLGHVYNRDNASDTLASDMSNPGDHTHAAAGTHDHTLTTEGESVTDKNMQPSLVVYIWERTA